MKKALIVLIIMAAGLLWTRALMSAPGGTPGAPDWAAGKKFAEGEVLVKYKDGVTGEKKDKLRSKVGGTKLREFKHIKVHHMKVSPGLTVKQAVDELKADPDVEYAEPNYRRSLLWNPNDYSASTLWGLDMINAPQAWDIQNSCDFKIGIVDTGMDYTHEDLAINNAGGYDFGDNDSDPDDDFSGHGTHVSGIIGAKGDNGTGVVGVCPTAKLMALKIFRNDGYAFVSDEIEAVNYAISNGITLLNMSIGDPTYSFSEKDALKRFGLANGLAIVAAGNDYLDSDEDPFYPAAYDLPYIVSVAASNQTDGLSMFTPPGGSNYGFFTVDLAAPGSDIYSTIPTWFDLSGYFTTGGTSMAAPHVAGVAALINTVFPDLDNLGIKNQLMGTVDEVAAFSNKVVTGGRLNAYAAIANRIPATPGGFAVTNTTGIANLVWTDNSTDEDAFRIERMSASDTYFMIIANVPANTLTYQDAGLSPAADDYYRVRAIKNIPAAAGPGTKQIRSMPTDAISPVLGPLIPPAEQVPYYPSSGGGGGCFIATSAYGTYMSPELGVLRSFRDNVMNGSEAGRSLIRLYYRNSPPLAETIKHNPALRAAVRTGLAPVVLALSHPGWSATALLLMAAALMMAGMINRERQILLMRKIMDKKGFTLIEVMVVVVILGLLVAFVAPRLVGQTDDARVTSARMQIGSFVSALKLFRNDNGFYPTTEQGLEALVSQPTVGREAKKYRKGGYIDKIPLDPWQNPYVYISPGLRGDIDVISLGADGVEGGSEYDADVSNWD